MLSIKHSVDLRGMRTELIPAIIICNEIYASMGYACVITSVTNGPHTPGVSLHPLGLGLDLRINHVPNEKRHALVDEIAVRLGPQFDVILEEDHAHVEYDPR